MWDVAAVAVARNKLARKWTPRITIGANKGPAGPFSYRPIDKMELIVVRPVVMYMLLLCGLNSQPPSWARIFT